MQDHVTKIHALALVLKSFKMSLVPLAITEFKFPFFSEYINAVASNIIDCQREDKNLGTEIDEKVTK
jgi:hypothetical protein